MPIRVATLSDVEDWAAMRGRLWPDDPPEWHRDEAIASLAKSPKEAVTFVAVGLAEEPWGFAEASLHHDHVNGCETSPVAFVEGIYVRPDRRGAGVGRQLVSAIAGWATDLGCRELASDAALDDGDSHAFHAAIGFEETERVVYFHRAL